MGKAKVIIADTDENYVFSLQLKFIEDFFEKIDLEIVTNKDYLGKLFSMPQKADLLIIAEDLYDLSFQKHDIGNIFLLTEQYEEEQTVDINVNKIFKYTSINGVFNEILGKGGKSLNIDKYVRKKPQIIVVTSAAGGVGKTTVAMGMSSCLTKNYKRVLYLNAERLQVFQCMMQNSAPITSSEIYAKLLRGDHNIYNDIKQIIRKEQFHYIPPFRASLMSLGISMSVYCMIAEEAKKSYDYDFIVVDTDSVFDEEKAKLIHMADHVIIVTRQTRDSIHATNILADNISGIHSEKYSFICNDFDKNMYNAIISTDLSMNFSISHYIDHIQDFEKSKLGNLGNFSDMQKAALLVV